MKAADTLGISSVNPKIEYFKTPYRKWVMFLAENLEIPLSASIAFDWSNALWAKPKPL
jgi:hypothetical protein